MSNDGIGSDWNRLDARALIKTKSKGKKPALAEHGSVNNYNMVCSPRLDTFNLDSRISRERVDIVELSRSRDT
jgi:hypothetical protein